MSINRDKTEIRLNMETNTESEKKRWSQVEYGRDLFAGLQKYKEMNDRQAL